MLVEWDRYIQEDPFGRIPDIARYLLLWHFGGCYVDTDVEPLRPMDELLDDDRPFAAWESDRTMCTAVLAAPPKHPAIGVLLDGLLGRLEATRGKPANEAVGPEYATAMWRERDDVRRLPPWSFYPVSWYERPLLGKVDYPERTYAVHHWAKGWGAGDKQTEPVLASPLDLSILVAFRDADGTRTQLWDVVREQFARQLPEAEIVVASDDGTDPFHKTLAMNRAAAAAKGNVFGIWDSDTWIDAETVRKGAQFVADHPHRWCKPWMHKIKLNVEATQHILSLGSSWDGTIDHKKFGRPESYNNFSHSPPVLVHRAQYEAVHGHDERFRGWGQEDVAFSLAMTRTYGAPMKLNTNALHLHHTRIGVSGNDRWPGQSDFRQNLALVGEYRRARSPDLMKELLARRDADVGRNSDDATRHASFAER